VELATAAETTTGTDDTRAVHPAGLKVELDKKANLASPALTGTPTAPTAANGTNTTQIATTAFVLANAGSTEAYFSLYADRTLANNTTIQTVFGVGVTLEAGLYAMDGLYYIVSYSSGTPIVRLAFGGTATVQRHQALYSASQSTTPNTFTTTTTQNTVLTQTAGETDVIAGGGGDRGIQLSLLGTVNLSAGGTFIPQIRFSTTPGTFSLKAGSYIRFTYLGASGADVTKGTWA
jgi:hypothetical protein